MSKFKVGDKVRILDGSDIKGYYGKWVSFMGEYIGEVHTVTNIRKDGGIILSDTKYIWDERGLELVTEDNEPKDNEPKCKSITITQEDLMKAQAKAITRMTINNPMLMMLSSELSTVSALTVKILFNESEDK